MAQGFKLVLRPSKPGEKDSEKKFYAVSKTNGTSSMKTLCKLISARSTVSSADVKAVLDNLNFVLDMELQEGRIVRLGDFGSFRISVSSDGVTDKDVYKRQVDDETLYKQFQLLSLHGQNKDALAKTRLGAWEYDIVAPYYKCNMTDIMAAIGMTQFELSLIHI